jgi:hypothetical protein
MDTRMNTRPGLLNSYCTHGDLMLFNNWVFVCKSCLCLCRYDQFSWLQLSSLWESCNWFSRLNNQPILYGSKWTENSRRVRLSVPEELEALGFSNINGGGIPAERLTDRKGTFLRREKSLRKFKGEWIEHKERARSMPFIPCEKSIC